MSDIHGTVVDVSQMYELKDIDSIIACFADRASKADNKVMHTENISEQFQYRKEAEFYARLHNWLVRLRESEDSLHE